MAELEHDREARPSSVSVVIPVYNRPLAVVRAIRTALAQTHPVDEIIVVEDGSPNPVDPDALRALDPRIRVLVHEVNQGGGAARNTGFRAAKGKWVAFLDSDDEWLPDKLERQMALLDREPHSVACFTGRRDVNAAGDAGRVHLPPETISLLDLQRINVLSTTSSAVIRRDVLNLVGGFDPELPSCQDWDLWVRLRARGEFSVVREPLVRFFQAGTDRITKNAQAVVNGHRVMFDRIRSGVGDVAALRRVTPFHDLRLAQIYFWDFGRPAAALRFALVAFLRSGSREALALTGVILKTMVKSAIGKSPAVSAD